MNILEEIAARTRRRMEEQKARVPLSEMERAARRIAQAEGDFAFPFRKALEGEDVAFICEVKRLPCPRESSPRISLTCKSPGNMRRRGRRPSPV